MFSIKCKADQPPSNITAKSFALFDLKTEQFLAGKNPYKELQVASLTKLMTTLAVLKIADKYKYKIGEFQVTVSKKAVQMSGTSAELQECDTLSIEELLYAMLLPSGNDAATALAECFGAFLYYERKECDHRLYSINSFNINNEIEVIKNCAIQCFTKYMNDYAKELKLSNSFFVNPHGLANKRNVSSAYDIAKISLHALQDERIKKIVATKEFTCQITNKNNYKRSVTWSNTNVLLDLQGYCGLKTGSTTPAGGCLATYYKLFDYKLYSKIEIVLVVLGTESFEKRFDETQSIIDWGVNMLRKQQQEQNILYY